MYENPGDELYFGEVYRQVLQEAWLPEGAEDWMRLGKSRRGRRPTQRGIFPHSPTYSQTKVRLCFSLCAQNWSRLPQAYPDDHPCAGFPAKKFWHDQKEERGLICSYYDHYMRYCMFYCLKVSCPPEDIVCYKWDPDSTKETIHGYWTGVYVIGGFPPYEWHVNDPPFWLQAVITSIPVNGITTREDTCGIGEITVTDYCGRTVEGIVTTPNVPWPYLPPIWPDVNPQEINPNSSVAIYIEEGVPPFIWSVTGTGFSITEWKTTIRNNVLHASNDACGSAKIKIIDCLGSEVTGSVRTIAGQWVLKSEGVCEMGGAGTCVSDCDTRHPHYELVQGSQKQCQTSYCPVYTSADHPCDRAWKKTLAEARDEYCIPLPLRCTTCIDPDHFPCKCTPRGFDNRRTWCLGSLQYYEWEC